MAAEHPQDCEEQTLAHWAITPKQKRRRAQLRRARALRDAGRRELERAKLNQKHIEDWCDRLEAAEADK